MKEHSWGDTQRKDKCLEPSGLPRHPLLAEPNREAVQSPIPRTMELTPEVDLELRGNTVTEIRAFSTGARAFFVCGRAGKAYVGTRIVNGSQYRKCGKQGGKQERKSLLILLPQMTAANILVYCFPVVFQNMVMILHI